MQLGRLFLKIKAKYFGIKYLLDFPLFDSFISKSESFVPKSDPDVRSKK
jgi:hypothetical protein